MRGSHLVALIVGAIAAWPATATATAEPVSFAHGTLDQQWTTTQPGASTGSHYTGTYHAAGDPSGDPPYMRRMTFYPPAGTRYDTSVPGRCTASDAELALRGPTACPEASRIGGGTGTAKAMGESNTLPIHVFNNTDEVVMVIESPGVFTVSRGQIGPDGSTQFDSPTCYPSVNVAGCPVDNALQTGSDVTMSSIERNGRAYLTTPPTCPETGYWESLMRFWWADGSEDAVPLRHPCTVS